MTVEIRQLNVKSVGGIRRKNIIELARSLVAEIPEEIIVKKDGKAVLILGKSQIKKLQYLFSIIT